MNYIKLGKEIIELAKKEKKSKIFDLEHSIRVWKLAISLGKKYKADLKILTAACLLHDLSKLKDDKREEHAKRSATLANKILLKLKFKKRKEVIEIIQNHSEGKAKSIEAKILHDCDELDALGTFGIFRILSYFIKAGYGMDKIVKWWKKYKKQFNKEHSFFYLKETEKIGKKWLKLINKFFDELAKEYEKINGKVHITRHK
jgi:putative nucleotidyltransferase with HDIG domain